MLRSRENHAEDGKGIEVSGTRRSLAVVAWVGLLTVVLVAFTALGSGPLAAPPVTDPGAWGSWAAQRDPAEILFALLRLVVIALAWYLLGVSVVGIAVRVLRISRLVRIADIVTVPAVRRLLQGALGLGLATAAVASVGGPGRAHGGSAAAAVASVETDAGGAFLEGARLTMTPLGASGTSFATMRQVQPPSNAPWVVRDEPPQVVAATWEVQPGQHFWSIAEHTLQEAWGRAPSDQEVEGYWRALLAENRDVLADPSNPDLVYPGQVFTLPPLPGPTSG